MNRIKIFDPNRGLKGEYTNNWQCNCECIHKNAEDIWQCTTCKNDVCDSCKNSDHTNHSTPKSEYTISLAHPNDCDCSVCDPGPYGLYAPVAFDKNYYEKIQIGTEDSLYYQECDFNPELLEVHIPDFLSNK